MSAVMMIPPTVLCVWRTSRRIDTTHFWNTSCLTSPISTPPALHAWSTSARNPSRTASPKLRLASE